MHLLNCRCMIHSHPNCTLNQGYAASHAKKFKDQYQRWLVKKADLDVVCESVEVKWECEFRTELTNNPNLQAFYQQHKRHSLSQAATSELEILQDIREGSLFGIAEVDIHTPADLHEKFAEMAPIFRNLTIEFHHLSEHMQQYVQEHEGGRFTPRRSLVGVLSAKKAMIITPLLQFYMRHGLIVTKVHQVLEWTPQACFEPFARDVIHHRSQADIDPVLKIKGEMMKLFGNSAYGRTLMRKELFTNTTYVDELGYDMAVRQARFIDADELSDNFFEVTSRKRRVLCNLPLQIGFFVYGYAKLRVLEFYFDFLCKYVPRNRFELLQTGESLH